MPYTDPLALLADKQIELRNSLNGNPLHDRIVHGAITALRHASVHLMDPICIWCALYMARPGSDYCSDECAIRASEDR
jgi:hypothetical protein